MPNFLLLATQCPTVQPATAILRPGADNPPVSGGVSTGMASTTFCPILTGNAVRADMAGRCGGGLFGVVAGLGLTAGSGLTLNIAEGYAYIDGIVFSQLRSQTLVNGARSFVWLTQAGAISVTTTTTAPATPAAYIGNVLTAGGIITSIDHSGVVYVAGRPHRRTADAAAPLDTPATDVWFDTQTAGGIYLWDGTTHTKITP